MTGHGYWLLAVGSRPVLRGASREPAERPPPMFASESRQSATLPDFETASMTNRLGLLCLAALCVVGCGYGELSPTAYEYAKALYSIGNRERGEKIEPIRAQIAASAEAGELSKSERRWLVAICDDCDAGRWEEATAAARRMMQDQVTR